MKTINIVILVFFSYNSFALKPDSVYRVRPEKYALIYKEFNVKTPDGFNIKTWFYPAQDSVPYDTIKSYYENPKVRPYKTLNNNPKPTIVICDGDAGNMIGLISLAGKFVTFGYNVVTFDWRGFGESDKFPIEKNLLCHKEFLIDYNAVIDSIVQIIEVDSEHIGLYGFSTGAYLSFAVAYKNENVKCFAGRALMTSFDEFLPLLFEIKPEKKGIVKKPEDYPIELYPINIAPEFKKPALLIVGTEDKRTPVSMSERIFEKIVGEKELWIVQGAEHGGINGPEYLDRKEFLKKTTEFYDKYLKN